MTKSIYTINLLNSLLPKNVNVDISRFPWKDLNEFVPEGAELPLRCDLHGELISYTGELAKGLTSYQIKRYSTIEYKTQTPCLICDPNSTNKLHPHKIRAYIESPNRLKTHGCIYELMMTNKELYASIDEARKKKSNAEKTKIVIRIKADIRQPGVKNFHPIEVIWKNFRKGVSYSKHDKREKSWVHRFVILIAQAWNLDFQTEVIFEGLNSDSGTPLRIDIGFKEQCEVLEIDGIQHAGCEYVRVSKGVIKEQA